MSPAQAIRPENTIHVRNAHNEEWRKREKNFTNSKPRFRVGDLVRIYLMPHRFTRSFHQRFSTQIYRVVNIHTHLPSTMYDVATLDGQLIGERKYANELQRVSNNLDSFKIEKVYYHTRRVNPQTGEQEVKVKFAELPESFSRFIPQHRIANFRRQRRRPWS